MPQNNNSKGTRLTGINPLAYLGVEPSAPPQLVMYPNQPTNRDINFNLGTIWVVENPFEVWMLVNKAPQDATKWVLLYPQANPAATLFPTDAGTAEADAITHELNILGGDNINTAAPGNANTIQINLDKSILLPATTDPNHGVIALGADLSNNRFLHNFGDLGVDDNNTFLGKEAGNFTLTGVNNTGIGALSLFSLTDGNRNSTLGSLCLENLLGGSDNIALGSGSGSNYVNAESGNILLHNPGVVAENNTTRIGIEGTAVAAHIAGINGKTVAGVVTPNTVVNIDNTGQLGQVEFTSSGATIEITQPSNGVINLESLGGGGGGGNPFAFFAYLANDLTLLTGSPQYNMGTTEALVKLFDQGNNFFPGDGAGSPAVFTAPVTGTYCLTFSAYATVSVNNNFPDLYIITTPRTYKARLSPFTSCIRTIIIELNMGETTTFALENTGLPFSPYQISGNTDGYNAFSTYISGYLINQGSSVGNFAQPFKAVQLVDTVNTLTGFYPLGSLAPLPTQYNIGNNFFPGDGIGTPCSFTAPATGIYHFEFSVTFDVFNPNGAIRVNAPSGSILLIQTAIGDNPLVKYIDLALNANDIVTIDCSSHISPYGVIVSKNSPPLGIANGVTYIAGWRIA